MKTSIDIPDAIMADAMKFTHAKTKREAVITALEELNRRHQMAKLVRFAGTFKEFMTQEELMESRFARQKRHEAQRGETVAAKGPRK